jgi:hypothetical protein
MSGHDQKSSLKILFHIGADKTGSTALQNMLYDNQQLLKKNGILYRDTRALKTKLQAGNGQKLCALLRTDASSMEIKKELTRLIEPDHLSIISSEQLSAIKNSAWKKLFEILKELGVSYQILAYVRSPLGYYISRYQQTVKRIGFNGDLNDFINQTNWNHVKMLERLHHFGIDLPLKVIPYDQHRGMLFSTFWDFVFTTFGIDIRGSIPEEQFLSNRGISVEEINMLNEIFGLHGEKEVKNISDFLVNEVEKNGNKLAYNSDQIEKIVNRHQEHVRWANDTFLDPNNEIQNNVDEYRIIDRDQTNKYPDAAIMMKVILFLLRRLDTVQDHSSEINDLKTKVTNLKTKLNNLKTKLGSSETGN